MTQIIFHHVTKKFGDLTALNDVSFEIRKGEFVFVIGKSGAGKSTLLHLLTKQEEVTSGQIVVDGCSIDGMKKGKIPAYRRRLGIVSLEAGLLKDRSIYDNIMFAMRATGRVNRQSGAVILRLLGLVGLANRYQAFPDELSGGEQARVLVARALSVQPDILVADEPTANLDPDSAWDLMQLFAEINYQGMTVLMASHARDLVTIMRKRCLTLVAGTLVADEKNAIYNMKAIDIFEERRVLGKK
ncbi:MAG: ATP-binding cassette domain-containing protein [Lachnospiraceae bacterium]|nr:ATP-binding cassette domain-containing protein [Lachnospiraceae bacterium]